ncbi:hypothetical protein B0H19DRAFT_463242 [Mycena capillaripes]|nr:hypothetical protein B0H19DRAFT_463242 [Mycena capillaripes]
MASNTQATSPLSSLAEWCMQHVTDVFEAPSDDSELFRNAFDGTFSPSLSGSLNGKAFDFDGLRGLVTAIRSTAPAGLKVDWRRADDTPEDPGNRSGSLVGEYFLRGIWRSSPGSDQLREFERLKKVTVRIESQSPQAGVDSRFIVGLHIVATDTQLACGYSINIGVVILKLSFDNASISVAVL